MNTLAHSSITQTESYVKQQQVFHRLEQSKLYQSYRTIFQESTSLPLELHAISDDRATVCRNSVNQNRFCHLLNEGKDGCGQCLMAQRCLSAKAGIGVQSISCFAGLQETAVPVVLSGVVIAQLKTGQICHEKPTRSNFSNLSVEILSNEDLEEAYMATPVVEKQKYHAMVTLLAAFSLQLSKLACQIEAELYQGSEDIMTKAIDYIDDHLDESIHLNEIASEVNISPFHFCRKFKESTGMTLTNYVAHRRIELVKEALLNTGRSVTDIAFYVGFQSLSQFNRSFKKIVGLSPTAFKRRKIA